MRAVLTVAVVGILLVAALLVGFSGSPGPRPGALQAEEARPGKLYGEWRIRVKPDKGLQYNQLIQEKGLPLFREAGGRMVGWWTTLVGDLYEHVTIWEYDSMASFEKAVVFLGKDERFGKFVSWRDPLLSGEESRFLRLARGAEEPSLPETAKVLVHEIHRVPLARLEAYMNFMNETIPLLKKHKFRPLGPWQAEVGRWSEVTLLFRYESLAERDRLIAEFNAQDEARVIAQKLHGFVEEITTRVLVPAPFAR